MEIPKGYKQSEVGIIPEDWQTRNISSCCTIKARIGWQGLTKSEYLDNGDYLLITATDFENGFINWASCFYVSEERYLQDTNIQIQPGDVLISKDGTIGKVAFLPTIPKPGTLNSGVFVVRPKNGFKIDRTFLSLIFKSVWFKEFIDQLTAGSTIVHLYQKDFVKFNLVFPESFDEQKRIADALSDVDELIAALNQQIEKKRQIKEGAMQQLLTGKTRLPGFTEPWDYDVLGNNSNIFRGGSPRPIENYLTTSPDGVHWVKIGDVSTNAKYIETTQEKIISEGVKYSREVYAGDFLLSNSMSFGRPYILKINGCIHDGWLVIQDYQETFNIDFLYYILGSSQVNQQYKSMAAGSSVLNLNKDIVHRVVIPIPTIAEQIAIAQILSDMDEEIRQLEDERDKYMLVKQGMMQELLTGKTRLN